MQVRRVVNLSCKTDPKRSLQLLAQVAPHLEELQLLNVDREHLEATLRMPKLWSLEVLATATGMCADPFVVAPVLPHDGGLRVLRTRLGPSTVASLVRAHQRTLETVLIKYPRGRPSTCLFEDLNYLGAGQVVMPRFKRCPYFPVRERGEFPALKSVEFEVPPGPGNGWPGLELDALQEMFPGVHIRTVKATENKKPKCR